MLGISLLFVGIVLVHNGILFMSNVKIMNEQNKEVTLPLIVHSPKSIAFLNVIVGSILVIGNFIILAHHAPGELASTATPYLTFQNLAAGLIFGFTYIFIAGNLLFKLDMRPFGLYCLGASIFAIILTVDNFITFLDVYSQAGFEAAADLLWLALVWVSWFILWIAGTIQFTLKWKPMEKIFPWISILVGIAGAFVPAILLLQGTWGLLA